VGRILVELQRPDAWMLGPVAAAQVVSLLILVVAAAILIYRHRFRPRQAEPMETGGEAA
jgi:prolipoprotein diacylglyceryltransferase